MATIKYIKDKDDNLVLPVTAPKAVIDEQGVNLETTLTNIKDKDGAQDERLSEVEENKAEKSATYTKGEVDSKISTERIALNNETARAAAAEAVLQSGVTQNSTSIAAHTQSLSDMQDAVDVLDGNDVIFTEDHTAELSPVENKIYREPEDATDPTYYIDWMWNGTIWKKMKKSTTPIENVPTKNSNNIPKSGGVFNAIQNEAIFDISVKNAVGGTPYKYADLADALGTNGANVPADYRHGGMSVRFIKLIPATYSVVIDDSAPAVAVSDTELSEASDVVDGTYIASQLTDFASLPATVGGSKVYYVQNDGAATYTTWTVTMLTADASHYEQHRLKNAEWSINLADWQGVDDEPTAGSENLVKSGGVESFVSDRAGYQESRSYVFAVVDGDGNFIFGVDKDAKFVCGDDFLSKALAQPLSLKVNVGDIVDNLTTNNASVPLSAKQGVVLSELISDLNSKVEEVRSAYSFITNDKYLIAIVDADSKVLWGIKKDGKLYEPTRYENSEKWLFVITDNNDNVIFGIRKDASIYAPGLSIDDVSGDIAELQDAIAENANDIAELRSEVTELQDNGVTDTVEVAIGKQRSYGTYRSELDASPIVDDSDNYFVGFKTIGKDTMQHGQKRAFIVFNHDDGHTNDLTATRRIYNKYGFNGSLCAIFSPFGTLSSAQKRIPLYRKWLNDGHELGLHAIVAESYWYVNRLYDVRPDGSTSFAPLIAELKGSNIDGTGLNTFGTNITADTTIKNAGYGAASVYNTPSLNVKVVEATQSQLDDVNRGFCFYGDRLTISGIEDMEIPDIMSAESASVVSKTRLQWLEYYYNRLIEEVGYSSSSSDIATRFAEDYDTGSGAGVYPDAAHILSGKMVYYGDTARITSLQNGGHTVGTAGTNEYQKVGKFTKGLFKDCYTCCNWEVMDRGIACAVAFFIKYYGLNHFTDMHRHGVAYTSFTYIDNGLHYMNREKTVLCDSHSKFFVSHKNSWCKVIDIMHEYGIDLLKEQVRRQDLDTEGQIGYYLGQDGIHTNNGFGGTGMSYGDFTSYLAMFGTTADGMETMNYSTFSSFLEGVNNWFKFCYENAGQIVTNNDIEMRVYTYIRDIVTQVCGSIGTGKIPCISVDTIAQSPAIGMAVDLLMGFFKDNEIDVIPWGAGKERILSISRDVSGNLFPNPGFNQTILNYLGGESTYRNAYIPDGWFYFGGSGNGTYNVATEEVNGVNTRVLTIDGQGIISTNILGLPQGDYTLSYDVKSTSSGSSNLMSYKIGDKKGVGTTISSYTHTNTWATREISVNIAAPYKKPVDETNPISVISDGYEDNVFRLQLTLISSAGNVLKIANVKLYKN